MIQQLDTDSVKASVQADPETIYSIISDVTRTPELSPEVTRCEWLDGATGPAVGVRFKATNKMPNRPTFSNKPVVTIAEPGRTFAFSRTEPFGGTVEWRYDLERDRDGTIVTESYTVTKPVSAFGWFIIGGLFGRKDRRTDLREGMQQTPRRLQVLAEADQASTR